MTMNQKITQDSIRFAPIALALVLFVVLGLMALRAHAEEFEFGSSTFKEQMQQNARERQELFQEQRVEFRKAAEEYRERYEEARAGTSTTLEELKELRVEMREQTQQRFEEQKEARWQLFNEQREEVRNRFNEKRDEIKNKMEERKQERSEEHKAKLSAKVQARLSEYVERIAERMEAAIGRLEQIADRIGARIDKMETEKGVDLSAAKESLDDAYVLIGEAKEYAGLIGEVSVDALTSENPQNRKDEVRDAVKLTAESIMEIHKALSEAVMNIKASFGNAEKGDEKDNATSTGTSTNETEDED